MINRLSMRSSIYTIAGILSLFLSFLLTHRVWVVNPDGVCYLQAAYSFNEKIPGIMSLCGQAKWPFYSIAIALVAKISAFTYLNSAYILDGFFSLLTVLFFIKIIDFLGECINVSPLDRKRLLWLALITILFSHDFNATREYIIRDHGYWAFNLLSQLSLLYYLKYEKKIFILGFSLSLVIATLFRIEGFLFLTLIPFCVFFNRERTFLSRIKQFIALNTLSIVLGIAVALWFFVHQVNIHSYKRLEDLYFQIFHGFGFLLQRYYWQGNALTSHVLGHGTALSGAFILFVSLFFWYIATVIGNVSLLYSLLIIYAWSKKLLKKAGMLHAVLVSYVLLNMLITVVFLGENMFLSKRYVLALGLTLMLWVPFALNDLICRWASHRKWCISLVALCLLATALGGFFDFGYSKKYIYDAGQWLKNNVPTTASLYSNDFQVMYYSEHFGNTIFTARDTLIASGLYAILIKDHWKKYDYLAIRFTKKDIEENYTLIKNIQWKPIVRFANERGDQVAIYKTADL